MAHHQKLLTFLTIALLTLITLASPPPENAVPCYPTGPYHPKHGCVDGQICAPIFPCTPSPTCPGRCEWPSYQRDCGNCDSSETCISGEPFCAPREENCRGRCMRQEHVHKNGGTRNVTCGVGAFPENAPYCPPWLQCVEGSCVRIPGSTWPMTCDVGVYRYYRNKMECGGGRSCYVFNTKVDTMHGQCFYRSDLNFSTPDIYPPSLSPNTTTPAALPLGTPETGVIRCNPNDWKNSGCPPWMGICMRDWGVSCEGPAFLCGKCEKIMLTGTQNTTSTRTTPAAVPSGKRPSECDPSKRDTSCPRGMKCARNFNAVCDDIAGICGSCLLVNSPIPPNATFHTFVLEPRR